MPNPLKKIDSFSRNILLVFSGTFLFNFFSLLNQLLLAHKLSPTDFAGFNTLLAIFMLIVTPLGTLQYAVAKYTAEFNSRGQKNKIRFLLSDFIKKALFLTLVTFLFFWMASAGLMRLLYIPQVSCGYIFAALVASMWIMPVLGGGVQGLEFFGWNSSASVVSGFFKLSLTFIFLLLGYNIAGALGAYLITNLVVAAMLFFALRNYLSWRPQEEQLNYREILAYLLPVAVSNFLVINLVSFDMVLVRYFFTADESGLYALAQIVGKIFLFLPSAISIVMFPRVSGLNAQSALTIPTLRKSLFYTLGLCLTAGLGYNFFPGFTLKVLTGKAASQVIGLGRLFSISMTLFALLAVLVTYFLSLKDFRFLKYLALSAILQFLAIVLFHRNLAEVQLILCFNAGLLFLVHLWLAYKNKG